MDETRCALCGRIVPDGLTEQHHLVPKCEGGSATIEVCVNCGDQLHQLFTVHELRDLYYTLELLLENERVQKWIKWIRKRPNTFGITMRKLKRRR